MERKMLDLKLQDKIPCSEIREKKQDNWHKRAHTETKVEMGQTYSKNEGQKVDWTLHRMAAKEREEIKGTTKQKMARWKWKLHAKVYTQSDTGTT